MEEQEEKLNLVNSLLESKNWEQLSVIDGVITERLQVQGSNFYCYKSHGHVNCKSKYVSDFIWNFYDSDNSIKKLDPDIDNYKIVSEIEKDKLRLCHQINKLPWPFTDRESVYLQCRKKINDTEYIYMYSVACEQIPEQPKKYVRTKIEISAYIITDQPNENGCFIQRLAHIDPRGNMPSSIINYNASKTGTIIHDLRRKYN